MRMPATLMVGIRGGAALAAAVALAVIVVLVNPAQREAALAQTDTWSGTTDLFLRAETPQIDVVVPVEMPIAVNGKNGTFISSDEAAFVNTGSSPLEVVRIRVQARNGVTMLSQSSFNANDATIDVVWARITPEAGTSLEAAEFQSIRPLPVPDDWSIPANGRLGVKLEGAMKNPSPTFSSARNEQEAKTAYAITWTVGLKDAS